MREDTFAQYFDIVSTSKCLIVEIHMMPVVQDEIGPEIRKKEREEWRGGREEGKKIYYRNIRRK